MTQDTAVTWRSVSGGWARGKARTSQTEREAVVAEVLVRLSDPAFVGGA